MVQRPVLGTGGSLECLRILAVSVVQLQVNVTTARSAAGSFTVVIFVTFRLFPSDWHFSVAASSAFA